MFYINTTTLEYPVTESQIRLNNPNTSFAVPFQPTEIYSLVVQTIRPPHNSKLQQLVEIAPSYNTDTQQWQQQWQVLDLPQEVVQENLAAEVQRIKDEIVFNTQKRLDQFAQTRGYDDIKSASDYAGCSVAKFSQEGTYCRDARAETWNVLYQVLAEVEQGTRPMPQGFQDIEPLLPQLQWPEA